MKQIPVSLVCPAEQEISCYFDVHFDYMCRTHEVIKCAESRTIAHNLVVSAAIKDTQQLIAFVDTERLIASRYTGSAVPVGKDLHYRNDHSIPYETFLLYVEEDAHAVIVKLADYLGVHVDLVFCAILRAFRADPIMFKMACTAHGF